ncbi:hypothetical protein D9756_011170 [Leucocoprinus leucothites]|uniref:Heterokaryon incompatibility domain-containing protein n=1 Tax=Leucocoprinus leucothites TaxID=201217 RepID=A0A8H5CQB9_9AGAR|nr:hypothetical protein D9756_011170 [Leucoagaricus leucothites]
MTDTVQPDPLLSSQQSTNNDLRKAWSILMTQSRPRRIIHEDPGVRGPLWFWSDPSTSGSPLHIVANIVRILFAILAAPAWMWLPPSTVTGPLIRRLFRSAFWGREWSQLPESFLMGSSSIGKGDTGKGGEYAAKMSDCEPRWLLEVQFRGAEVVTKRQVKYEDVKKRIQDAGYTALGYPIQSAEQVLTESTGGAPNSKNGKYSLSDRREIAGAILEEYGRARVRTAAKGGKTDGIEYVWLDEFCLSEEDTKNEVQAMKQKETEIGRWADIFRLAKRVVVFCHVIDCDHTGVECPWSNRLFTLAEIVHATKVVRIKRTYGNSDPGERGTGIMSSISSLSGNEFRAEIQARAAEAKMWHLSNIMQHANNSSGATWQSTVHSLVLEALRRKDLDTSASHNLLGKALNGLLPRRAQIGDLTGVDGWADLVLLLELNQGFYNATLLASVCRLAESDAPNGYRWCQGKPVLPKEGLERFESLSTAIPVNFHDKITNNTVPVLSFVNTKTIALDHMLQRDSGALEQQEELKCLKFWARFAWITLVFLGFILGAAIGGIGGILYYVASILYVILQLFIGTIYVTKDRWVVIEDFKAPGASAFRFLQAQDPSFRGGIEWGSGSAKQITPRWEDGIRHLMEPRTSRDAAYPYPVTLIDLRTGILVKSLVTSRPNDMAVLAIHGMGVTCMLLDRDTKTRKGPTIGVKVGMTNLPSYVLAQASPVGSLYVGGHAFRAVRPCLSFWDWFGSMIKGEDPDAKGREATRDLREAGGRKVDDLEMGQMSLSGGTALAQTASISSTAPILHKKSVPYRADTNSSSATFTSEGELDKAGSDLGDGPVPTPLPNSRYRRELPNVQWFPERRGIENV